MTTNQSTGRFRPKTEAGKVLAMIHGGHHAFLVWAAAFDRLVPLWESCGNGLWLLALLRAAKYQPVEALEALRRGLYDEIADQLVEPASEAAVRWAEAFARGEADLYDLTHAHARAYSVAHRLRLGGAPMQVAEAAFAAAAIARPVHDGWMRGFDGKTRFEALEDAFKHVGRVRSPNQRGPHYQPDYFAQLPDDPAMRCLADRVREALGNPFTSDPHLAVPQREKLRAIQKLERRDPSLVQLKRRFHPTLTYRLPGQDEPITERPKTCDEAVDLAYKIIMRHYADVLARPPRRGWKED